LEKTSSNNKQRVYRLKITLIMALTFFVLVSIAGATPYAYITNEGSNTVSVIDTATNSVAATVNVGNYPYGVAISPDGNMVYVTDYAIANGVYGLSVSVIDTSRNSVIATWPTFDTMASPRGVAVSPDEAKLYVTNAYNRIYAFDTTTNKVIANSSGGSCPVGVAITPDRTKAYVTYSDEDYVGIFDTVSDKIKGE